MREPVRLVVGSVALENDRGQRGRAVVEVPPPPRPPTVVQADAEVSAASSEREATAAEATTVTEATTDQDQTVTTTAPTTAGSRSSGPTPTTTPEVIRDADLLFGVRTSDGSTPEVLLRLRVGGTDSRLRAALVSLRDSIERQGVAVGEVRASAFQQAAAVDRVAPPAIPVGVEDEGVADASPAPNVPVHSEASSDAAEEYAAEAFRREIAQQEFAQKIMEEQREKALRPTRGLDELRAAVGIVEVLGASNIPSASCWFDLVGLGGFDCEVGEAGVVSIVEPFSAFAANATESFGLTRLRLIEDVGPPENIDYFDDLSYNSVESGERPESPTTASMAVLAGEQAPTSDEIISSVVEQIRATSDPLGRIAIGDALSKELMPAVYEQMMADAAEFRAGDGTWREIAESLGVTPQAVQKRLSPEARRRNAEETRRRWSEAQPPSTD